MTITDEVAAFLGQPHFAKLATLDADGTPRLIVAWYHFDGQDLLITSFAHHQSVKNIGRDPRVTLLVEDRQNPYRFATVKGWAELAEDEAMEETRRHALRYVGPERGEGYFTAHLSARPRVIIRIHPERVSYTRYA